MLISYIEPAKLLKGKKSTLICDMVVLDTCNMQGHGDPINYHKVHECTEGTWLNCYTTV